jgi:hypothetical protein
MDELHCEWMSGRKVGVTRAYSRYSLFSLLSSLFFLPSPCPLSSQTLLMYSLPPCLAPMVFRYMSPFQSWTVVRKLSKHWRSLVEMEFYDAKYLPFLIKYDSDVDMIPFDQTKLIEQSLRSQIRLLASTTLKIDWIRPLRGCTYHSSIDIPKNQETSNKISIVHGTVSNFWNGQATLSALRLDATQHDQLSSFCNWEITIVFKHWQTLINADCERCFNYMYWL